MDLERPVEPELVQRLCQLAVWAPNHHRTEPWRFAVLTGRGRERFGNAIADIMESAGEAEHRVTKTRTLFHTLTDQKPYRTPAERSSHTATENLLEAA
jgi:nitroreductase